MREEINQGIGMAKDAAEFSQMQLSNFLKESKFKRDLDTLQQNLSRRDGEGKRIASDPHREYILTDKNDNTATDTHASTNISITTSKNSW